MIKRIDRIKLHKRKGVDVCISSVLLNILLCIISIILILSEALIYKNVKLYLSACLIVCIILVNVILYESRNKVKSKTEYLNSVTAKHRIYASEFELYNSKDNLTGLYNNIFLKSLLKKINIEKFTPTTIAVFHVQGLACISNEEMRRMIVCNAADIVLKNKFKSNIACISENNNIILFFINYNKDDSHYISEKICDEFNEINKNNNIKLIYGIKSMYSNRESIYKVVGQAMDYINSSVCR